MSLIYLNLDHVRPRALLLTLTLLVAPLLGLAAAPALAAEPVPDCTTNGGISTCTITFDYAGAPATWTVPAGVTTATFDLYGAQGGGGALGGAGGRSTATLGVSPGDSYQILVGGQGGYNGGGAGGTQTEGGFGGGTNMFSGQGGPSQGGQGEDDDYGAGSGGGGGYFGGGGGSGCFYGGGGGGGGSSYATTAATAVSFENGVREGDGLVIVTYNAPADPVAYRWSGFAQPVDNLPTINSVKAGQAIPVKFSLGGNYGLNIFAQDYPKVQIVACASGTPSDEVEQTVTVGASGLSYEASTGQYSYTWKTDKKWAGTCRQLVIKLADGSEHIAGFQLR